MNIPRMFFLILDTSTGPITPKFHVVFDDWFSTVSSRVEDLPDFNSNEWMKMFGDTLHQYCYDSTDDPQPSLAPLTSDHTKLQKSSRMLASEIKYPRAPLDSNIPISTSLDPAPNIYPSVESSSSTLPSMSNPPSVPKTTPHQPVLPALDSVPSPLPETDEKEAMCHY